MGKWEDQPGIRGATAHWLNSVEVMMAGGEGHSESSQVTDCQSLGQVLGSSPQFS